jgi:hypothetical protein
MSMRWSSVLIVAVAACSSGSAERQTARTDSGSTRSDSSAGEVLIPKVDYRSRPLTSYGGVAGTITLPDAPDPSDGVRACGSSQAKLATDPAERVVVWISGITSGVTPDPDRRTELTSEDCDIGPRVQAVQTGTTVNVFNDDRALHRLVFTHLGGHDTLSVMPFANTGEVVPSDRLAKSAGIVEVRCSLHPWTHGYLAVFDSPYFAMADARGAFAIDSVPPGDYTLMSWWPGLDKPREQKVHVDAGKTATVSQ